MKLLITLLASGIGVSLGEALGMKLRGVLKPGAVFPMIVAAKAGLEVPRSSIETQFLAGGDADAVVNALVLLKTAGAPTDFNLVAACDLAGWDALGMAQACVRARERFPDLEFQELSGRRSEGEDVIGEIDAGSFVPNDQSEAWRVRMEFGPMTFQELEAMVASGELPQDALALRPGTTEWRPVRRFVR